MDDAAQARAQEAMTWLTLDFDAWSAICHSRRSYTPDAPAMLSTALIRERQLRDRIAELEAALGERPVEAQSAREEQMAERDSFLLTRAEMFGKFGIEKPPKRGERLNVILFNRPVLVEHTYLYRPYGARLFRMTWGDAGMSSVVEAADTPSSPSAKAGSAS